MVGGKSRVEIVIAAKDRTAAAFAKVKTQMNTMKGGAGRLGGAMNGLKGGLSNVTSSLGSFGAALGPVGIAVAGAAVVMATLGGAAIKASLEFEKAVATIRVGTGATGEALAGLESSFKTVFTAVPTTTANAATAIADLNTRLGLTGEPLEALATQFLNLSRITGTDVAASISSATRVMHDFDVSAQEQAGTLDYLFKVSQSTGLGMTQLGNSMTQYGSVMRQMGFDINESAALLGKFEKEGVNLQLVLGSLRMGLANFAKAGEEPVEALSRVITEIQGMGSVADANMKAIEIFGSRAGPDMAAAIREGRFSIDELMATLDASTETINKAAADTLTFGDKWTLLKNNIMEAIAPVGDVITNVLGNAIEGISASFNMLQAVIGPVMGVFKSFFDAINSAISSALAPLTERLEALQQKFKEGSERLTLFSDIFTIVAAAAKWLGEAIGALVSMALTPLVAKLKEGMDMLGAFYDKLGPIKSALEWVGEGVHNVAESFRETKPPIEEVKKALEELAEKGPDAPKAVTAAWALAIKSFQEGTGTYKEAIDGINKKIDELTEEWMTASDERKTSIDNEIKILKGELKPLEDIKKAAEDHFSSTAELTEKATEKMEEFTVAIGDTIVSFKGAAAEVVKNADAYEKLQNSAQKIMDLDWSVFTEFEAALPNIESGIQDMESSFVGLKDVLEDNIGSLENVQESVMDISEIAAPFLEAGFLEGIESIGSFAGSLKDAGSAINTFSSLQDVSIEGCINFSLHVNDMVSALQILESQMEDLVPVFGDMDALIKDTLRSFVSETESLEKGTPLFKFLEEGFKLWTDATARFSDRYQGMLRVLQNALFQVGVSTERADELMGKHFDTLQEMARESENAEEFISSVKESEIFLGLEVEITTASLKKQTGQLSKITDALEPYLKFMRTLNELAALSTLSTDELNNGLNAINDTLVNLGKSLETFDLRPVMAALFGTEIPGKVGEYTGGIATGFTDTMKDFAVPFSDLITYVERLSFAISSLANSFEALANISESVLADQKKLKDVFEGITDVMANFSKEMGGTEGFAQKIADGMGAMLKSAAPLIIYFQKNNAAVEQFNKALSSFRSTITNLIGVFEDLSSLVKASSEAIVVSAEDIEEALSLVDDQLEQIALYLGSDAWGEIATQLEAVGKEWKKWAEDVDLYMPAFNSAVDTFSTLISKIVGLSEALKDMRDMSVLSIRDIDEALKNIPVFLDRFVDALALNMDTIKGSLKELHIEWGKHADEMVDTMPAYEDSTSQIGKLVGSLLSLNSALKQLAEMGTISSTEFDRGFSSLMASISNFAGSLSKNVQGLISSLWSLSSVWQANKAVLKPLMNTFITVTYSFWKISNNANAMAESFRDLQKNSGSLEKGFSSLIKFINQVVEGTKKFYTPEAAAELARYITDVGKVIDAFVGLERELEDAMGKIKKAIGTAVDNIEGKLSSLSNLVKSAYYWGANIMGAFITGINSMSYALERAVARQAAIVEAYLGAASPTKSGPLSHLDEWPRNLIQSYSSGIEREMHTLNTSFAGMAAGPAAVSGGNKNVNLYVTQNIGSRADADYSAEALHRVLTRHNVM